MLAHEKMLINQSMLALTSTLPMSALQDDPAIGPWQHLCQLLRSGLYGRVLSGTGTWLEAISDLVTGHADVFLLPAQLLADAELHGHDAAAHHGLIEELRSGTTVASRPSGIDGSDFLVLASDGDDAAVFELSGRAPVCLADSVAEFVEREVRALGAFESQAHHELGGTEGQDVQRA